MKWSGIEINLVLDWCTCGWHGDWVGWFHHTLLLHWFLGSISRFPVSLHISRLIIV